MSSGVATSRYVPIRGAAACDSPARPVPGAWRQNGAGAVGRGAFAIHNAVRTPRDRVAEGGDAGGGRAATRDHLGGSQRHCRTRRGRRLARRRSVAGRRLGIDEHSYLKHFQFVTIVVDLDEQTVLRVADDLTALVMDSRLPRISRKAP